MSFAAIKARKAALAAVTPEPEPVASPADRIRKKPRHRTDELARVLGLPVTLPMSGEEQDVFSREHLLRSAYENGFRLLPEQANGLSELMRFDGLFAPIPVGKGKTLLSLMAANHWLKNGHERGILCIPPEVLEQLTQRDIQFARTHAPINYQIHVLGGRTLTVRRGMARARKPGLYVMPYSLLSTKDTDDNIADICPTFIIADEAHRIANHRAARTKRLFRFIDEMSPKCAFLSGTITAKSIRDYLHLSKASLRDNNFLPNVRVQAEDWADIIDAESFKWTEDKGEETTSREVSNLRPMVDWARQRFEGEQLDESVSGIRKAFKLRMMSCPGVVAASGEDIGTTLTFSNRPVQSPETCEGWDRLQGLIKKLQEMWLTPNDDEINHALHIWKWMYELTAGFYNELVWPTADALADRRKLCDAEAEDLLERSKNHHDREQEYNSLLRSWLEANHKPKLDTPHLIGLDMARNGAEHVGEGLYDAWMAVKEADFDGRVVRDSRAVRVCPYKINAAVEWASHLKEGGIAWVWNIEVGQWLAEALTDAGMDPLHCPAGDAANKAITDPENADRIVVASITAHGTGKNLQHFQNQCFVQWPRAAKTAEQVLGRLHRTGQKADEIVATMFNTTQFDEMNLAACINDALYIHQSTGSRQKLIYGQYDPPPRIYPSEFLRERGADVKILSAEQRAMMVEKFG